jgi:hypothetical protein
MNEPGEFVQQVPIRVAFGRVVAALINRPSSAHQALTTAAMRVAAGVPAFQQIYSSS